MGLREYKFWMVVDVAFKKDTTGKHISSKAQAEMLAMECAGNNPGKAYVVMEGMSMHEVAPAIVTSVELETAPMAAATAECEEPL